MPECAMTAADGSADKALRALLTLRHLYDGDVKGRGARSCIYDALEALRPGIGKLDENELRAVWDHLYGEDDGG